MRRILKLRKGRFILGAVIIFSVIGYLIYAGIRDTRMYYVTPSELLELGEEGYGQGLRIGGIVSDGSVEWDSDSLFLTFSVEDGSQSLPVSYQGVVPDNFQTGVEIIIEGTYQNDGIFHAAVLLPKCPSKYEAET